MTRQKMLRRRSAFTPFLSTTPFPRTAEEMSARAREMFSALVGDGEEQPVIDWFPALDVSEGKDECTVTAELPGLTIENVKVHFSDGVLTMRGEKSEEQTKEGEDKKYHMWERRYGAFQRSLPFPGGIAEDRIKAEFKDGILTVRLPKAEEEKTKRHEIPINKN